MQNNPPKNSAPKQKNFMFFKEINEILKKIT